MFKQVIKDRKSPPAVVAPPSTVFYPAGTAAHSANGGEVYKEIARRNAIISELVGKCPYKAGDIVQVVGEKDREKEGDCQVVGMVTAYYLLEKDNKWPKDDNPMIVTARSFKNNTTFFCTTNYLEPKK